ncbi:MerR family transcriptional regulator [Methylocapsa sp. S129]|uniref:MerR family transcriptional regulator n=1 Tax=Methylocapsa sp. S129 TaxID=1641869 RepID=UPI00131D6DB5|nr:MerR family transcriptional regulator [Methylocapsa sp. S129]
MDKSPDAFRTISEAADDLDLPQHVLRFWETRFPQIKPLKRGGGRRYYRPDDVELLRAIKQLLYGQGYTIKGVQKLFKEQGARAVASARLPQASDDAAFGAAAERSHPEQHDPVVRSPETEAPTAVDGKAASMRFSLDDLQALRAALADISEGERILALAR